MNKIQEVLEIIQKLWDSLPKSAKVLVYMIISFILSEGLIEIGKFEQTFLIRVSAQIINLLLVFIVDLVKEIKAIK